MPASFSWCLQISLSCSLSSLLWPGQFLTKTICVAMGLESSGHSSGHTTKRNGSLSRRIYQQPITQQSGVELHEPLLSHDCWQRQPCVAWVQEAEVWVRSYKAPAESKGQHSQPFALSFHSYMLLPPLLKCSLSLRRNGMNVLFRVEPSTITCLTEEPLYDPVYIDMKSSYPSQTFTDNKLRGNLF